MPRKTLEIAVIDFIQAVGLLVRRVRAASASHELSLTESAVLARLAKDGPATTAELARAEMALVERKQHPTDGRQVNIELTGKGALMRNTVKDAKRTWLAQAISQLDEPDRETLFKAGEIIKRLAEK
jgi:DNA-binding MarR family transcriptional regulator